MSGPDLELNRLDSHEDIPEFLAWLTDALNSNRTLSIDTETESIDTLWVPRLGDGRGYCRLWQIGHSEGGWAIDAQEWHGLIHHAMTLVNRADNVIATANGKYDQHVLDREGWPIIPWDRMEDVLVMHRLVRPWQDRHGLKPACEEEFGEWAGVGKKDLDDFFDATGTNWATIPTDVPVYWGYGVIDTCLTAMLYDALAPEQGWWYDVEMEYIRLCFGMEKRGVQMDLDRLAEAEQVWLQDLEDATEELRLLGITSPGSNKTVIKALEAMGFDPQVFSDKTGEPTLNKMVLNTLATLNPELSAAATGLMRYRRAQKWHSTYGVGIRHALHGGDVLHFTINTMQARTFRNSISKPGPALQTIPKDALARYPYMARKGKRLYACDYSSQEVRVHASLSKDPGMRKFFEGEDDDYHAFVANMAGIPRQSAKVVNYARAYGAGVEKLALSAGCSTTEMQRYLDSIDGAFPRAMAWKDEVTREAERRSKEDGYPWVHLPYGIDIALEEGKEFTTAANSIIQGHGAMVLKLASTRIAQAGYGDNLVLPMHDEFLAEFDQGDTEGPRHLATLMQDDLLDLPLTTDLSPPLTHWGQAYEDHD